MRKGSIIAFILAGVFVPLEYYRHQDSLFLMQRECSICEHWIWTVLVLEYIRRSVILGSMLILIIMQGYVVLIWKPDVWRGSAVLYSGKIHLLWGVIVIVVFEVLVVLWQ